MIMVQYVFGGSSGGLGVRLGLSHIAQGPMGGETADSLQGININQAQMR
jgi:hypothetical protein